MRRVCRRAAESVFALELGYADLGSHRMVTHARTLGSDAEPGVDRDQPQDHGLRHRPRRLAAARPRAPVDLRQGGIVPHAPRGRRHPRRGVRVCRATRTSVPAPPSIASTFRWGVGAQWVFTSTCPAASSSSATATSAKFSSLGGWALPGRPTPSVSPLVLSIGSSAKRWRNQSGTRSTRRVDRLLRSPFKHPRPPPPRPS